MWVVVGGGIMAPAPTLGLNSEDKDMVTKALVRLIDGEIPGLRKRVKMKLTTVKEESRRYGVGVESIRRAVRGDTFGHILDGLEYMTPAMPGVQMAGEEEVAASLKRLAEKLGETEKEDDAMTGGAVDGFLSARKMQVDAGYEG